MRAFTGEYDAGYGKQDSISMQFGSTSEKSSNILSLSFAAQEEIMAGQIPKSKSALLWLF